MYNTEEKRKYDKEYYLKNKEKKLQQSNVRPLLKTLNRSQASIIIKNKVKEYGQIS